MKKTILAASFGLLFGLSACGSGPCGDLQDQCDACENTSMKTACEATVNLDDKDSCQAALDTKAYEADSVGCTAANP